MAWNASSACARASASGSRKTPRSSAPTKPSSRTTATNRRILDLYHEKAGILDGDADTEVDLASYAYQIWKNAIDADPELAKDDPRIARRGFLHQARSHQPTDDNPPGVLVYLRTAEGNDALAWMDNDGKSVTESQFAILKAAECAPDTPALARQENHHALVREGRRVDRRGRKVGRRPARPALRCPLPHLRTAQALRRAGQGHAVRLAAAGQGHRRNLPLPLRQQPSTRSTASSAAASPIEELADLVIALRDEDRLCLVHEEEQTQEPHIICSLGLSAEGRCLSPCLSTLLAFANFCKPSTSRSCSSRNLAGTSTTANLAVAVDGSTFAAAAVAEKRGMQVFQYLHA